MERSKILYIDDETINLENFTMTFEKDYDVFTAKNGEEALAVLERIGEAAVVITDQRMPGMGGVDVLYAVKELFPLSTRMVITAYPDVEYLISAINRGHVYCYVFKPWDETDLKISVKHAVEKYNLTKRNQKLMAWLERMNSELEDRVNERTKELHKMNTLLKLSNKELRDAHKKIMKQAENLEASNAVLNEKIKEIEESRTELSTLRQLLPICSYCKKIRDDKYYWEEVDNYIQRHMSKYQFTHCICPECYEKKVVPELESLKRTAFQKKPSEKTTSKNKIQNIKNTGGDESIDSTDPHTS